MAAVGGRWEGARVEAGAPGGKLFQQPWPQEVVAPITAVAADLWRISCILDIF